MQARVENPLLTNRRKNYPPKRSTGPLVPFLTSTIFHLSIILGLTFLVLHGRGLGPRGFELVATIGNDVADTPVIFEMTPITTLSDSEPTVDAISEVTQLQSQASPSAASVVRVPSQITEIGSLESVWSGVSQSVASVPSIDTGEASNQLTDALVPTSSPFAGTTLENRSPANRARVAFENGGTLESEKSVEDALVWLASHQYPDGGWSMNMNDPGDPLFNRPACPCEGRCTGSSSEHLDLKRHAATGLALLCFLGAGYTHQEGKYKDTVYRALAFLMDTMRDSQEDPTDPRRPGQFSSGISRHLMYEQGIATFAICEALQMTKDPLLKESCQRAIDYVLNAEHYGGSWGYQPRTVGDLSIVGWQVMALRSAVSSDLIVNRHGIAHVDEFLNTQMSSDGSGYGYRSPKPTPTMTAIGILMRLYRGWQPDEPRIQRGVRSLFESQPSKNDLYFNYYATQVIFYSKSPYFPKWNQAMREYLIATQNHDTSSHEFGSWYFDGEVTARSNSVGGRLYCTAMATLTLEVYYRYLPTYKEEANNDFKF